MPALRPIVVIAFGRLLNLRVCVRVNFCDEAALPAARSFGALLRTFILRFIRRLAKHAKSVKHAIQAFGTIGHVGRGNA